MNTYRQIILNYLNPKYHSLFFQINIYDFLDQPISKDLSQIIVNDYFEHKRLNKYVYYNQHPSILIIVALRAQPNKEYLINVPRLDQTVFKNA